MQLQKVISKKNLEKKLNFSCHLLVRGVDPRIRICTKMSLIRNMVLYNLLLYNNLTPPPPKKNSLLKKFWRFYGKELTNSSKKASRKMEHKIFVSSFRRNSNARCLHSSSSIFNSSSASKGGKNLVLVVHIAVPRWL